MAAPVQGWGVVGAGCLTDFSESAAQVVNLLSKNPSGASADADALATLIRGQIAVGNAVILIGHSQGTLIAQQALRDVISANEDAGACLGYLQIATPLSASIDGLPSSNSKGVVIKGSLSQDIILGTGLNTDERITTTGSVAADEFLRAIGQPDVTRNPLKLFGNWTAQQLLPLITTIEDMGLHHLLESYLAFDGARTSVRDRLKGVITAVNSSCALAVTYSVSASSSPSNGGSVSGSGSYPAGTQVTLTALPAAGFSFTRWTENDNQVSTSATYQFTATSNRSLVAVFTANAPSTYAITVDASPSDGGTVSGGGSYAAGTTVAVRATAASGWDFVKWTENGSQVASSASYEFTASADRSLIAEFQQSVPATYTISVSVSPSNGGSVSGAGSYPANSSVTVMASAATGYAFTRWTEAENQVSSSAAYEFTITRNRSLVAVFAASPPSNAPRIALFQDFGAMYPFDDPATVDAYLKISTPCVAPGAPLVNVQNGGVTNRSHGVGRICGERANGLAECISARHDRTKPRVL